MGKLFEKNFGDLSLMSRNSDEGGEGGAFATKLALVLTAIGLWIMYLALFHGPTHGIIDPKDWKPDF